MLTHEWMYRGVYFALICRRAGKTETCNAEKAETFAVVHNLMGLYEFEKNVNMVVPHLSQGLRDHTPCDKWKKHEVGI